MFSLLFSLFLFYYLWILSSGAGNLKLINNTVQYFVHNDEHIMTKETHAIYGESSAMQHETCVTLEENIPLKNKHFKSQALC